MTIPELKTRCGYGNIKEGWAAGTFIRPLAIYLTWVLVKLRLTANQATLLSIGFCLAGCILIAWPTIEPFGRIVVLVGIACYVLGCMLDSSDGDLARYHRASSLRGVYLDNLGHILVLPLFELAVAVFLFHRFGNYLLLILGGVGMILARNAPWLALCETFTGLVEKQQFGLLDSAGPDAGAPVIDPPRQPLPHEASMKDRILDLARPPAVNLILLIAVAVDLLSPTDGWVTLVLYAGYLGFLLLLNALRIRRNWRGGYVVSYCGSRLNQAAEAIQRQKDAPVP